ncbi:MAG: 3',5'-cyclic-nucleotide phosphodiesterase [Pedobacter sp.]|uniref:MBL fold metallo-hydrolase n=1 Tax=Pedobacter sp. TaxID=1411316 RepID=UPI003399142B
MIKTTGISFIYFFILCLSTLSAQQKNAHSFKVLPLGVKGGLDESNLSAYMIAPEGSDNYICADAGTVRHGIDVALAGKALNGNADEVLKAQIKGYLISHAHLDHVAGLIMNSPEDSKKNIYALPSVAAVLKDKYFTWKAWANFTNEGDLPHLDKYTYVYLKDQEKIALAGTEMQVTALPLSHGPSYESTAFLISHGNSSLLYLGDTGADRIEKSDDLQQLWAYIAPLIKKQQLKAIFIETSFFDKQPEKLLFGHLTPQLLMEEMGKLAELSGLDALKKVPIVITHMKSFGETAPELAAELNKDNVSGFKLVFPVQGKFLLF